MTTNEVLVAAKGVLITNGWCQGGWGDMYGDGNACIATACIRASKKNGSEAALAVLRAQIGGGIFAFNDAPDRTFAEVIDAFDKAIVATAPIDAPTPEPVAA